MKRTVLSLTCFEQPSVHPQKDPYMNFHGIFSNIRIRSMVDIRMCFILSVSMDEKIP
jgi:hypothetical protein